MVKLWLMHSGEVSLPDQIATQLRMAVLSGDLRPCERLPSVRVLARRFGLHHNTVSAAYRRLEQEGWVDVRRGSGVYVRERSGSAPEVRALGLESIEEAVASLVGFARSVGVEREELARLVRTANVKPITERILLVESDADLREIVMAELLAAKLNLPLAACGLEELQTELKAGRNGQLSPGTVVVTLPSKLERVSAAMGDKGALIALKISSAASSLAEHLPKADPSALKRVLIGLASSWPQFMDVGRTMLLAAGVEPEALVMRDAREPGWAMGLESTSAVVCDSATAERLPCGVRPIVFRLVADESMEQLRTLKLS
jgi:DNA-binding transcriptional regulator YhcF (GntR family)